MELDKLKKYCRIDYDDDDDIILMFYEAVLEEMADLIPGFDSGNLTKRQEILICTYVKDLYDNRDRTTPSDEKVRFAVHSMLLKEMLG